MSPQSYIVSPVKARVRGLKILAILALTGLKNTVLVSPQSYIVSPVKVRARGLKYLLF